MIDTEEIIKRQCKNPIETVLVKLFKGLFERVYHAARITAVNACYPNISQK